MGVAVLAIYETTLEILEVYPKASQPTGLFEPEKLLRLSEWMQERSISTPTKKLPDHQLHQPVEDKKADDTTAYTSKSSASRKRRMQKAPSGADSTASRQNARQ